MSGILVVDDISTNRVVLGRMLQTLGYTPVEADSGEQALELFRAQRFDLVLMDISMPGMDGREAAGHIKQMAGDRYVPVIFVTAMKQEAVLADALAAGGDDFISKPVDIGILESKIKAHLRIRALNHQLDERNRQLEQHNDDLRREQELIEHFFENALRQSFLDEDHIRYHLSSASLFNGDLLLAERGPRGGLYGVLGDFTGHGLGAAMGTLPVAQVFFTMARKGAALPDIACEINRHLYSLLPASMFFAATLFELDTYGERISVWAGGMPAAYVVSCNGEIRHTVVSRHVPLGISAPESFDSSVETLAVGEGDRLYVYTDGIIEASGPVGEMFGEERLKNLLMQPGDRRLPCVLSTFRNFQGDRLQEDDISLVEICCRDLPPATSTEDNDLQETLHPVSFSLSLTLTADDMRNLNPVARLIEMLATQHSLHRHKGILYTILSELYNNALEHGLLGLDSAAGKMNEQAFSEYYRLREARLGKLDNAEIRFDITLQAQPEDAILKIRVSDSGDGFSRRLDMGTTAVTDLYGRGLSIVSSLCEALRYSDNGHTVDVVYRLSPGARRHDEKVTEEATES